MKELLQKLVKADRRVVKISERMDRQDARIQLLLERIETAEFVLLCIMLRVY